MAREVLALALVVVGGCGGDGAGGLAPRRYTFGVLSYTCSATVLDVDPDGRARLSVVGDSATAPEDVQLEHDDAEVILLPGPGATKIDALGAETAIIRRTECNRFDVVLEDANGFRRETVMHAADPCFTYFEAPENGDEYDPCYRGLCNEDPC